MCGGGGGGSDGDVGGRDVSDSSLEHDVRSRVLEALCYIVVAFGVVGAVEIEAILDGVGELGDLNLGPAELFLLTCLCGVVGELGCEARRACDLDVGFDVGGGGGACDVVGGAV